MLPRTRRKPRGALSSAGIASGIVGRGEIGIRFVPVLADVEAFRLLLGTDAETHDRLDREEHHVGEDEGEYADREDALQLGHDLRAAGEVAEDADSERAPDAAGQVHRDRTNRVVDL